MNTMHRLGVVALLAASFAAGCGSSSNEPQRAAAGTSGQGQAGSAAGGSPGGAAGQLGSAGTTQAGTTGATAGAAGNGGSAGAAGSDSGAAGSGGVAAAGATNEGGAAGATNEGGAGGGAGAPPAICPPGPFADSPLPADPTAVPVIEDLRFTEGPVWIAAENALFFSDLQLSGSFPSRIYKFVPGTGNSEIFIDNSGSNGLAILDGQLLACTHDTQQLSVYNVATKERSALVTDYMGDSFSSPNDVAVRSDGNIYFSDPDWQLGARPQQLENAVYRRSPEGVLSIVDTIDLPNGVTLSPDENTLYVSNIGSGSEANVVRAYDVAADGATSNGRTFINTGSDGMGIDCAGNLYLTGQGDVRVYSPAGQLLGTIGAHSTTNVAFGGPERKTLYITGNGAVYALEMNIPGYPY